MTKEIPRLSASIAHSITMESPLHAWAKHRLLGNRPTPSTGAQLDGRVWHALLLNDDDSIEVIDAENFRTKDAREARDAAIARGKTPITAVEYEKKRMVASIIAREIARFGIVFVGECEKRIEWVEKTDNEDDVLCSGFVDHYDGFEVHDLKTVSGALTLDSCTRAIADSHALLQDPAYRNGVAAAVGSQDPEQFEFTYVFAQTAEPYAVCPVRLSGEFRVAAQMRWRRAIHLWHQYLSKGTHREDWPGPVGEITTVHPPGWLLSKEIEMEVMNG